MVKGACLEANLRFFLKAMKTMSAVHYLLIALGLFATNHVFAIGGGGGSQGSDHVFPIPETVYSEMEAHHVEEFGHELGLIEQLKIRAAADPFNVVATIIFFLAVVHTFLATTFSSATGSFFGISCPGAQATSFPGSVMTISL